MKRRKASDKTDRDPLNHCFSATASPGEHAESPANFNDRQGTTARMGDVVTLRRHARIRIATINSAA